jgi:FHS family Na+ dependent glucose MFS transporter 1
VRAYWTLALLQLPAAVWLLRLPSPSGHAASAAASNERLNRHLVALIVLFFVLYTGAEVAVGGWIYSYAVGLRLSSQAVAAYLTSAFWGALTVGRLLAVPLALRFPPHSVLLADCVGCLVSLGILLLGSQSVAATFVGTCGVGLSMASIFPAALSLAQGRMRITGRVTGWFFVGASGGGMTLPWLIGQFFDSVGPRAAMVILFIDMTAALAVLAVLTLRPARPVYHWITGER